MRPFILPSNLTTSYLAPARARALDFRMSKPLSKTRARTALVIAIVVDVLQIAIQTTGPVQIRVDWPLDLLTGLAMMALVGFHWAFLPTFLAEAVPWFDMAPTWTLAVIFATSGRGEVNAEAPKDVTPPTLEEGSIPNSMKQHRFRVRPKYRSKNLLVEFCDDPRAPDFPDVHTLLSSSLMAEPRQLTQDEIAFGRAGAITNNFSWYLSYPGGTFEINRDDMWGLLFILAAEPNRQVISDIEKALLNSGQFIKEEVDFSNYA